MRVDDLLSHFKTQSAAARALGIKQPSIAGWVAKGEIPLPRQFQIEVVTGGALRADRNAALAQGDSQ